MTPEQMAKLQELLKKFNTKDSSLSNLENTVITKMLEAQEKMQSFLKEIDEMQNQVNDLNNKILDKRFHVATEQGKSSVLLDVLVK